jgi:hypothetical protein
VSLIVSLMTLVAASGTRTDAVASSPRTLTFEQRLEAQRRIEEVLWYLVRPSNCAGAGSYEDDGNPAAGTRDESIAASPNACP